MDDLLACSAIGVSAFTNSPDFASAIGNLAGRGKYKSIKVIWFVNDEEVSKMDDVFAEFNKALDLMNELFDENEKIENQ